MVRSFIFVTILGKTDRLARKQLSCMLRNSHSRKCVLLEDRVLDVLQSWMAVSSLT